MDHGSPGLVLSPKPPLFEVVHPNPYLNDSNPPEVPDVRVRFLEPFLYHRSQLIFPPPSKKKQKPPGP